MQMSPSDPPAPPPAAGESPAEPGTASPERRAALLADVAARDWTAAERWCRAEMRARFRSWLCHAVRAFRR